MQWSQHLLGLNFGQVLQVVFQYPLLDRHLGMAVQVLHLAAAASASMQSEMRTCRTNPQRALAPHRRHHPLLPLVLAPADLYLHFFARQGAFDEHDLAFGIAAHALGVEVNRVDAQPFGFGGGHGSQSANEKASRAGEA